MEQLEGRLYWSVGLDANGWTLVTPSAGENIIYVSNEGSDSNSGTSASASVKSFAKAQSLMKNGQPNELLLESGETFTDTFSNWSASGQDQQDPIAISSFVGTHGIARPLVYTGTAGVGFETNASSGAVVSYLDILGIQFDANLKDPTLGTVSTSFKGETKGFEDYTNGTSILIEDSSFNYYGYNFDVEALGGVSISNFEIRRSVVSNAYTFNGGRSQGIYAYGLTGVTIVQSDFDHDGWNATPAFDATDIGYNHDMYIASTCTGVDIENNIIAESSYAGIMARAGGIINNNLFIDDTVACSYGAADGADSTVGGVTGSLIGNTIVGDKAEDSTTTSPLPFGQGFVIANISATGSCVVSGNLFTADTQNAKPAILLTMATGSTNASQEAGLNNVTLSNNIVNGWRYGLQTDARFVAGGTGEYALNNLKITKNDFVDSTVQLVRHDSTFSTSQESWSLDRYYDPSSILAQSKWVTLVGNNVPFATWAANYDIGATALSALPYLAPTRTVATYDTTVGGTGTFQDYLANAALVSINNYQTQYMATAAASYVEAGFNIISGTGGTSNISPTTASATTADVNTTSLGATYYSFTVNFTGGAPVKASSLATGNILVTGPNGFSQLATFYSEGTATTDSSGYQHTPVTYRITPNGGSWATGKKQDGTYTISMLANQVSDLNGNIVADGVVGTFSVDLTPPAASVTAAAVGGSGSGATSYGFSIAYSDASGVDPNTLYSGQVQVTGPNGYSQYAALGATTTNSNGGIVANYTITPPGGSWLATANGTYAIVIGANMVYDLAGNPLTSGTLGTFAVQISGAGTVATGSISGIVFNDANGDGLLGSREQTLVGVQIFIDLAGTGVYTTSDPSTMTGAGGAYTLMGLNGNGLTAGRYTVAETAPPGYGVTTPVTGTNIVTLTAGQAATGVNFANQIGATTINNASSNSSAGTTTPSSGISSSFSPALQPVTPPLPPVVVKKK